MMMNNIVRPLHGGEGWGQAPSEQSPPFVGLGCPAVVLGRSNLRKRLFVGSALSTVGSPLCILGYFRQCPDVCPDRVLLPDCRGKRRGLAAIVLVLQRLCTTPTVSFRIASVFAWPYCALQSVQLRPRVSPRRCHSRGTICTAFVDKGVLVYEHHYHHDYPHHQQHNYHAHQQHHRFQPSPSPSTPA